MTRLRAYLWPGPGQSTHPRVTGPPRWRTATIVTVLVTAGAGVLAGIVTILTLDLAATESPYGSSHKIALGTFILTGLVPAAVMLTVAITRPLYLAERRSGR